MITHIMDTAKAIIQLVVDFFRLLCLMLRPRGTLAAENLFLRKQLAFYRERNIRPRRLDAATRLALVGLSKLFNWEDALVVVQPRTLVRWHREGFRLLWRWKSKPGRLPIPEELRSLIRRMAWENPTWGEERIANELLLKLGIRVSPRTVQKYMPKRPSRGPRGDQSWSTLLRNHAEAVLACDFFVVVTAMFRVFYVFIVLEHGPRRILYCNATDHPTAEWTLQQLREAIPCGHGYRFLIHDRHGVFSQALDRSIENMGLRVLKTPYRSPQANSLCERAIGTMRRECLDHMIPLTEKHLRRNLKEWVAYCNRTRPHSALGPGVPEPPRGSPAQLQHHQHRIGAGRKVISRPVLNGLHHEYGLTRCAA